MSDQHGRWQGELHLPGPGGLAQDEEWCEVHRDGSRQRIRFHDYGAIYEIPGLYERLFYDELRCASPSTVRRLLGEELARADVDPATLVALDLGAGNGMVAEELADLGVGSIVGVDILPEAAAAARRDRPGLYDDYLVADLADLDADEHARLASRRFTGLTTVAALGFGDMPPQAFAAGYNFVEPGGWVAFNIKDEFLAQRDSSGFSRLIERMRGEGAIEVHTSERYRHRLAVGGTPLHYVAMVAVKNHDAPIAWADEAAAVAG